MVVCDKCGNEMKPWKLIGEFDYIDVDYSGVPGHAGEGEGIESGIQGDEWQIYMYDRVWYYEDAYGYCFEAEDLVDLIRIVVQHMYDRQIRLDVANKDMVKEMAGSEDVSVFRWCNDMLNGMILDTWKNWKEFGD